MGSCKREIGYVKTKNRIAFTLIELLVVVAIIGVLAGLMFPAYQYAREVAKKTRAKADIKQLEVALKAVQSDFRGWPTNLSAFSASGGPVTVNEANFLQGQNSRSIVYMDFTAQPNGFVDPWRGVYRAALANAQGYITPYGVNVCREMGAWSLGKDTNTTAAAQADDVTSWQ
jgi:prepilin-type N-terminal cleavage/methylation domain-containing protein